MDPIKLGDPEWLFDQACTIISGMSPSRKTSFSTVDVVLITEASTLDPLLLSLLSSVLHRLQGKPGPRIILDADFYSLIPPSVMPRIFFAHACPLFHTLNPVYSLSSLSIFPVAPSSHSCIVPVFTCLSTLTYLPFDQGYPLFSQACFQILEFIPVYHSGFAADSDLSSILSLLATPFDAQSAPLLNPLSTLRRPIEDTSKLTPVHIFGRNISVLEHNESMLAHLPGSPKAFPCIDNFVDIGAQQILDDESGFPRSVSTLPVHILLTLAFFTLRRTAPSLAPFLILPRFHSRWARLWF
jgi:hypothetical protein